uniref:Uncharacterized protein n=1 Tax=Anguilla anguilla TaxID=7936 RepID=A0A0E9VLH1_ANGAN
MFTSKDLGSPSDRTEFCS